MTENNIVPEPGESKMVSEILALYIPASDDATDEEVDRICESRSELVKELVGIRGGIDLATQKLTVLMTRMREADLHIDGGEEEMDYRLVESAFTDLQSVTN